MTKPRYLMIGGFLGAGKTTAVLKLAEYLTQRGLSVGLITNDQSFGLVDTTLLSSHGYNVAEITGGCFCCKFNSLLEASQRLSQEGRPDVFIAEPVGSCTDLKATVSYPLRRIYGDEYAVAPLSVLVDPVRAMRILGLETGKAFSHKVLYVYQKQLEEAEIIVINKSDLLSAEQQSVLEGALRERFPQAEPFTISARKGFGLETWFERTLRAEPGDCPAPEVDYDLYAEGEALLGWLNCTAQLMGKGIDGNQFLLALSRRIQERLTDRETEIAHLKMTLTPTFDGNDIAVLNLVRNEGTPEMSHSLQAPLDRGELIINLRAESDPALLKSAVEEALHAMDGGIEVTIEHLEHFRPGRPVPTHRMAGIS